MHSAFKHKLHLVTRLAKQPGSTACQTVRLKRLAKQPGSSPTFALEHSCARASSLSNLLYSLSLAFSEFVRTGALPVSEFQTAVSTSSGDLLQNRGNHDSDVTRFRNTHTQAPHKIRTIISRAHSGYPLLCRCAESAAPPQY